MKNRFKVLEFVNQKDRCRYAVPTYGSHWAESDEPDLLPHGATIRILKSIYPDLDYSQVRLVEVELKEIISCEKN